MRFSIDVVEAERVPAIVRPNQERYDCHFVSSLGIIFLCRLLLHYEKWTKV